MKHSLAALFCIVLLGACSPNSLEDFRREGEALTRRLIEDLKGVHSREDLLKAAPQLKKKFDSLVDLMMASRVYQQRHPEEEMPEVNIYSELLLAELKRVYCLEGGREIIETAEREALLRLDAFEKKLDEDQSKSFSKTDLRSFKTR